MLLPTGLGISVFFWVCAATVLSLISRAWAGNTTCASGQLDWYTSVVGESPCAFVTLRYREYGYVMMFRAQALHIRGCVRYATTTVSVDPISISLRSSDLVYSQIKSRTSGQIPLETIVTTKFVSLAHALSSHFLTLV